MAESRPARAEILDKIHELEECLEKMESLYLEMNEYMRERTQLLNEIKELVEDLS